MLVCLRGDQNRPPQDGLLWREGYFERKAVETPWAHEKLYLFLKEFKLGALPKEELSPEITFYDLSIGRQNF